MEGRRIKRWAIGYFVLMNSSRYIEELLGGWSLLLILFEYTLLVVGFIGLIFLIIKLFSEKFTNKTRNKSAIIYVSVLILTILFPRGIIDFNYLEGEDLFFVTREGTANCTVNYNIKKNGNFIETDLCFGVIYQRGAYVILGDTIHFYYNNGKKSYGVFHFKQGAPPNYIGEVEIFDTYRDSVSITHGLFKPINQSIINW